jgi:UDP-2,3-diacylglucosamine hydrolase
MKTVFFSAAHLSNDNPALTSATIRIMRDASSDADIVVFLGDLFEFYHGFGSYIYPFYAKVVELLRELASTRIVYFIEGNHEFGMGPFFESHTGAKCVESLSINIAGLRVFVSHGDEMGFPMLRAILRSRFIYSIMDLLGPEKTWKIAIRCRPLLSKSHKSFNTKTFNRFRSYGKKKLAEGYDAVIMAHSHMADIQEYQVNGKTLTYMNTGDLIESSSYGVYTSEKGFAVVRHRAESRARKQQEPPSSL